MGADQLSIAILPSQSGNAIKLYNTYDEDEGIKKGKGGTLNV